MKRIASIFALVRTALRAAHAALALSLLLSLFAYVANADVRNLVTVNPKVSWTGNPQVIYLHADGTIADESDYDHLALKYTDTASAGTFTIAEGVKGAARVLLVGGGGAGGSGAGSDNYHGAGGGGGGGGLLDQSGFALDVGTYTITVGKGGEAPAAGSKKIGGNGFSSLIKSGAATLLEAFGGGGGGAECEGAGGANLGSGGGGSLEYSSTPHIGGICTTGQGNNGGDSGTYNRTAGGGGGAKDPGGTPPGNNKGAKGGDGLAVDIIPDGDGNPITYAGGGGSGTRNQSKEADLGAGGAGGGGRGAGNGWDAISGGPNTGGGGGGGTLTTAGANGGSGVVIVRITQLVETRVPVPVIENKTFNRENQVALDFGIAYTYVSGDTNATNVGSYSFVVKPGPDLEWDSASGGGTGEKTVNWSIVKRKIEKPTVVTGLVYDGTEKVGITYADELPDYCTFDASSVTNATNAGTYPYSVSLKDTSNTTWADGTTASVSGTWTISPVKVAQPQPKAGLVYDGSEQAGFASLDYTRYELTAGVTSATDGGTYNFTFALLGNAAANNYVWDTDPVSSEPYSGEWSIAAAANEITSLSIIGWRVGNTPNLPSLTAKLGAATVVYSYGFGDDAESITEWLDDATAIGTAGTWVLRAVIPETSSWSAVTGTTTFVMWDDPAMLFRNHVEIKVKGSTSLLTNFVVPLRISTSRIPGFSYEGADSSKLAFVDKKSGNLIPHDVDTWDESGESVVWVKLATLPTEGTYFTFYWNLREGHVAPENTPTDVWSDYAGVWHMGGGTSKTAGTEATKDSTGNAAAATVGSASSGISGVVGGALNSTSNSGGPILKIPASDAVNNLTNAAFTASFWAIVETNSSGKTGWPVLYARRSAHGTVPGYGVRVVSDTINQTSGTDIRVYYGNGYSTWTKDKRIAGRKWQRHDVMYKPGRVEWYIDGAFQGASVAGLSAWTNYGDISLGGWGGGADSLVGAIDEFRMRSGEISTGLIAAERNYHTNSTMVTSGVVYKDGLKVDYWVVEPAIDKTQWDVTDTEKGQITNYGQLRYGQVTNYIYSVYDESEVYSSISEITKGGTYRAVFARVQTEDFQPLEYVIEFRITQSKPYYDIGGNGGDSGRVLLMNNHIGEPDVADVDYQGWYDADNAGAKMSDTPTYWHHENLDPIPNTSTLSNLMNGTESILYAADGRRLWHIVSCRHGNTFPISPTGPLNTSQNYLPWSASYSKRITSHRTPKSRQQPANRSTVGQLIMQNTTDAVVYSSCFTNGIGTIYFDAVNGWCRSSSPAEDYENYKLVVEIATNTVENLEPTDVNSALIETNSVNEVDVEEGAFFSYYEVVTDDDGNIVTTNYYAVVTNGYGKLEGCWHAAKVIPFMRDTAGGTGTFDRLDETNELKLAVVNGGTMGNFYRVVVPVDITGPVRFRIRRTTRVSSSSFGVDEGGFILLDNIIASPPAMGGSLRSPGHYDGTKSGKRQIGWELATSVPYPSITDDEVVGRAVPTYYVNYGDGTKPNTNEFFHSAKMHYRWSYLGQVTNDWSTIVLNPADGFKAMSPFEIPDHECDVEYWYEYITQAPYYSYVDYSGVGTLIDYTEERGVQTNTCPLDTILASGSTNWFFRVRDGKSDYSGLDIVFKREGSDVVRRSPMVLVGDHVWRGFIQTPTNTEGKISWRIEALDRQTEPYAEYEASTNRYYCTTGDLALPVSDKLDAGTAESWSTLDLDALTGYVMFQVDDQSLGLTVVHADYQNFNVWSDAKGSVFVGSSTSDDSKSGTSPKKQTFAHDFDTWKAMPVTITNWQFSSFSDIQPSHLHGRAKAYTPFESDSDGLWECGPGMWVAKEYKNDATGKGVALQMEGQGKGNLRINDIDYAPRGVESVSFNARLGQFVQFRDFNYYNGERHLNLTNYTFMTRVAFDQKSNKDFKGNASLSIVADYLQNKGCYEARWEYIGTGLYNPKNDGTIKSNKGQRLCLYRWNVTATGAKETLLTAWTNTVISIPTATSLNGNFMPFFITVSNDTKNACTWVAAGVRTSSLKISDAWPKDQNSGWYVVACRDADPGKRLVRGTYGVLSANCDGVFGRPQYTTRTMLTSLNNTELSKLVPNQAGYFSNSTRPGISPSNISDKTAGFGTEDTEWNILPGRMKTKTETFQTTVVHAIIADPAPQTLSIYSCTVGKSDWGDTPLTDIIVTNFNNKTFTLPLYTTKNCGLKFTVGGLGEENRTDIVIDSVSIRQFRGDGYSDMNEMLPLIPDWTNPYSVDPGWGLTNWLFTSAWITNKTTKSGSNVTTNGMLLLSARRTKPGDVSSIRSPLMDGYEYSGGAKRGIGLGMVSYDYEDAQENARLLVQVATNGVRSSMLANWDTDDDTLWTTIATNDFSKLSATERAKGTISTYIGLHGVTGLLRIVVDPDLVRAVTNVMDTSRFGEVKISKVVCRDEPALDSACWWGWNLRMVGTVGISDVEGRMYLPDYATDAEDVGMSMALNNSITEDIVKEDEDAYKEHVPFVQTPTFASEVVGEVSFKARRYDTSSAQPASVTLYGSVSGAEDSMWTALTNFTVESSFYQTYTYKANMSSRYAAFRLGVSGVPGVKNPGPVLPSGYDAPVRVMIDEVFVSEAVYARMAFRNVGTIRNRDKDEALNRSTWVAGVPGMIWQPLCGEGWGVQCEIYAAQLAQEIDTSFQPEVVLHWFEGKDPWGFEKWKDKTSTEGHKFAALSPASDTNSFYRSSYESSPGAVVPMSLKPGTVVQYMLEVRYRQIGSDEIKSEYLTPADWTRPDWYRPVDFNADLGGGTKEGFSAYCILDTVAPGWAWINEVNLFGKFDDSWNNTEENCQFVEIAAPVEADLTDWKLLFYGGSVEGGGLVTTNVAAVFGTSELPGTKPGAVGAASNMVFRVIASPKSDGVLKKSDGTLDATWDFSTSYTDTFTRNGAIYALHPFGIQLVRPTGIVEHEIVCIGTNYFGSIPGLEQYYDPTNAVAYFQKYLKDCDMFYAGADQAVMNSSGEYRSLGVFESAGETSNQWNNVMKRTPGRINENQMIDPDHPTPNGESIVVFCNVDSELGHVRQTVGDAVETNAAVTVFIRRGSTLGTNIVYTVDPWYELGSVTTNGQPAAFGTTGVRKYVANVGAGASNNVTVIATAKIDSKLVNEYGLTDVEPYRDAIMDWLNKGSDLYGNSWAYPDSGEIKLADLIGLNNQWYTNLSLRAMYWLDMDPTVGNLALKGGMSKAPVPISRTGESGQPVIDIDLGVFMQITNRATGAAWTPYALRGLEPGSSSRSYGGNWTSATFKVVGFLNTGKTSWRVRENRVPLRWFVFQPNSFVQPGNLGEFTSDIEIIDPFSTESPAFTAGWAEWAEKHGRGQDFYFWDLDDRLVPISVETLKTVNKERVHE